LLPIANISGDVDQTFPHKKERGVMMADKNIFDTIIIGAGIGG